MGGRWFASIYLYYTHLLSLRNEEKKSAISTKMVKYWISVTIKITSGAADQAADPSRVPHWVALQSAKFDGN